MYDRMTKRLFTFVICAAILLMLSPAALAEEETAGFYNIGTAEGLEIIPVSDGGFAVLPETRDADGDGADDVFYPGAVALNVTLPSTEPGALYLLTLSASGRTLYADQRTGGGTLSFGVGFTLPDQPTELTLEAGSTATGFARIAVTLFYTPSAAAYSPKPSYADCGRDDACPMAAFTDLDAAAWYHDGVHYVLENGIMNGVGDGLFKPADPTSRAMIVTMLWRLEGMPEAERASFSDVPENAWYAMALNWAAAAQIVEGHSPERFAPDEAVSREQLGVILWRYAVYKGMDALNTEPVRLGVFLDAEQISGWALDGVQWAVDAGLISGIGHEKLSPKADASRAQVATMLMRYALLADADE